MRVAKIMGKDRDQVKRKYKAMQKKNSNFGFVLKNDWKYRFLYFYFIFIIFNYKFFILTIFFIIN